MVDGKPTHVIGVPLHWGFTGQSRKGYGANTLTPSVGDANVQTPEFKAFLVNIEKTSAPISAKATVHAMGLNSFPSTRCSVRRTAAT